MEYRFRGIQPIAGRSLVVGKAEVIDRATTSKEQQINYESQKVASRKCQACVGIQRVFRVDDHGERSLWTIVEADLQEPIAEYMCVVEGERLSRVRVQIESLSGKHCRVRVRYVHTAISEKGPHFVASVSEQAYAEKMRDWRRMVSSATTLRTGRACNSDISF